ncbi:hypothetical protein [Parasitella parasitica]|uniref:Peptidase A2 domain-containing protein n=1 Tax=Parasitella parasitica TaxID=35722 RepID=A0A0B7MZ48_9FUNG|nr:hypothetical protein [Parasitella parasitica]
MKCRYHPGLTNHSVEDCRLSPEVKKKIDKAIKKFGPRVRICHKCRIPNFKHGRQCKEEDLAKLYTKKKDEKNIVSVEVKAEDMDTDDDSDEFKMTFAALTIEDNIECKLIEDGDFSEPPKDLMKNNSIILPITLESHSCIVKTYFLLDTGASFSCISPALANKLKIQLNKKWVVQMKRSN